MELLGLDMVAQQLPAITDAAVLGNINFGVNAKNWLVAQLGPIFFSCSNHRCNSFTCKKTNGWSNWLVSTMCDCICVCIHSRRIQRPWNKII